MVELANTSLFSCYCLAQQLRQSHTKLTGSGPKVKRVVTYIYTRT